MKKLLFFLLLLTMQPTYGKHIMLEAVYKNSTLYPGTERKYWVYVPDQYKSQQEACLFMIFDGIQCNAPDVFDELISEGKMPVTIGVFMEPGKIRNTEGEVLRYNRSNEYDMTDNRMTKFLEQELFPAVESMTTPDGRQIKFSHQANDCAIFGLSSGGIASFNAAWQRPDMFSRVFSAVGTFVPFRGGNNIQAIVRKTEPLPLRIFLQDGSNDSWNPLFGSWYEANRMLESALLFSGYELKCDWTDGGHNGQRATEIFKDVVTWLWQGWPSPVKTGLTQNNLLKPLLIPGETWVIDNSLSEAFQKRHGKYDAIYPDGSIAVKRQKGTNCLWQYILDKNGKATFGQRFYWLHTMDNAQLDIWDMDYDSNGNLFVTTPWGIQVCDQNGRVRGILRWRSDMVMPIKAFRIEQGRLLVKDGNKRIFVRKFNVKPATPGIRPKSQKQG